MPRDAPIASSSPQTADDPVPEFDLVGFTITPSRALLGSDQERLDLDIGSLLASLAYPPPGVADLAFDLRYLAIADDSITGKQLVVALLCRLTFAADASDSKEIVRAFQREFHQLLRLHLDGYGYRVAAIKIDAIWNYLEPFTINDYVEITRRITKLRPLGMSRFQGRSPMSRAVDMLLRQPANTYLSVYLEPHPLASHDSRELEAYGFETDLLSKDDHDLRSVRALLGDDALATGTSTPFRMSVRLASDGAISQYLINLVGAEISGRRDYMFFRPSEADAQGDVRLALSELRFHTANADPALAELPSALRNLVHLFQVGEAQAAFRLPSERIATSRERTFETYPAPVANLPRTGLTLGMAEHPSYPDPLAVRLQKKDRRRHMYIVGKTGTGKSMLLLNMLVQDLESGAGLCLIDPHGDLVNALLPHIPASRASDVVLFDPADPERVAGLNFLQGSASSDPAEKDFLVQEIIGMVLRMVDYNIEMYGPVGQQMTRMACLTLMAMPEPPTLLEVPRLFASKPFRAMVLKQVSDPELKRWWAQEWELKNEYQKQEILGWFTSKFEQFISAPQVRNVVGQARSTCEFEQVMDSGGILLANLSRGRLGALNSGALGSMLLSKLLWAATRRAWIPEEKRHDFYLYVDEFQNFITDSFETILSEARKYRLNLVIAHQHLGQLQAMGRLSNRIERAVFGNIGTMVSFRLGTDAFRVADEFGEPVATPSLRSLENRYAVAQLLVDDVPTVPFTMRTTDYTPPTAGEQAAGDAIRSAARSRNTLVDDINAEILRRQDVEGQ